MNEIIPFSFENKPVRLVTRDGEPWFVTADACRVLEIANSRDAIRILDQDEKGVATTDTPGGPQEVSIISEPGLYKLIARSRKPEARRFDRWVRHDVLPSIRKTGGYGGTQINVRDPGQLTKIAIQLIEVNRELQARAESAEGLVEAAKPKTEFYDQYACADGLYGLQNVGRILGRGPNKFVSFLKHGYMFYQGGELLPKVRYREMGIFEVKSTLVEDKARLRAYITPKGVQFFAKKLGVTLAGDMFNGSLAEPERA